MYDLNNIEKHFKTLLLIVTSVLSLSCTNSNSSNSQNKEEKIRYIHQLLNGNNKEFYGCSLLINISEWKYSEQWGGFWSRHLSWKYNDGVTQLEKNEVIYDMNDRVASNKLRKLPNHALVYVGKWHYIKRLDKHIRLVGYQKLVKGKNYYNDVQHFFESKNKNNITIKELKLTKKPEFPGYTQMSNSECAIKWYDRYGYNAIAETKRVWAEGFWGKLSLQRQLEVTGKIIQAPE